VNHPITRLLASTVLLLASASACAASAQANAPRPVFCVWDVLGKAGDTYAGMQDYALAMTRHGVDLELKAYLDERIAAEDFRTGQCAAVIVTGFRARAFNLVTGTLDSMGSATVVRDGRVDMAASYGVLHKMIQVFATPQAAAMMVQGQYEIGGILPLGAAYPIVRDRQNAPVQAIAGKRIGVFDNDRAQGWLAHKLGAQPVAIDVTNVASKFNNGMLDLTYLPALTYRPFELAKGMGNKGAFVRMPVMLPTMQIVLDKAAFPEGFGQASRAFWVSQYERVMQIVGRAEASVPPTSWYEPQGEEIAPYIDMMRLGRRQGVREGYYSKRTINLLKKARCEVNPGATECLTPTEVP